MRRDTCPDGVPADRQRCGQLRRGAVPEQPHHAAAGARTGCGNHIFETRKKTLDYDPASYLILIFNKK